MMLNLCSCSILFLILYYRNLQSLQPHLLRTLILGIMNMCHLFPKLPHKRINRDMRQACIDHIPIYLLYFIQRTLLYNTSSQIPFHIFSIPACQHHLDILQRCLIIVSRLWSDLQPGNHSEQTTDVTHKAIVPIGYIFLLIGHHFIIQNIKLTPPTNQKPQSMESFHFGAGDSSIQAHYGSTRRYRVQTDFSSSHKQNLSIQAPSQ